MDDLARVQQLLAEKGVRDVHRLVLLAGPGWMLDPAATAPCTVYTAVDGSPRAGWDSPRYHVVVVTDGGAYTRDRAGVAALFRALGYPRDPARLTAEEVLEAWLALGEGLDPAIASMPEAARDSVVGRLIAAPTTRADGDARITVGWSASWKGHLVTRYTLRVEADGTVHAAAEPGVDVLYRARAAP